MSRHTNQVVVTVHGEERAIAALKKKEQTVNLNLLNAANEGADIFKEAIEDAAPVDTGTLEQNIIKETQVNTKSMAKVGVGPNEKAYYGMFPELGTKHQPARPYIRPSFQRMKRAAGEATKQIILTILKSS